MPPSTGKTFFAFRIAYAKCGTKPDLHGQFYENTVSKVKLDEHTKLLIDKNQSICMCYVLQNCSHPFITKIGKKKKIAYSIRI